MKCTFSVSFKFTHSLLKYNRMYIVPKIRMNSEVVESCEENLLLSQLTSYPYHIDAIYLCIEFVFLEKRIQWCVDENEAITFIIIDRIKSECRVALIIYLMYLLSFVQWMDCHNEFLTWNMLHHRIFLLLASRHGLVRFHLLIQSPRVFK